MSQKISHHKVSRHEVATLERKISAKIAQTLHQKYIDRPSAVKAIAARTGGAFTTVKKWYEGQNPPSLGHFILLSRWYDEVLVVFLELSGNGYLIDFICPKDEEQTNERKSDAPSLFSEKSLPNVPLNVPLNSWRGDLNERQRWFLTRIKDKVSPSVKDIQDRWSVTEKTAKRDIADLKKRSIIKHDGAKKNGHYVLL